MTDVKDLLDRADEACEVCRADVAYLIENPVDWSDRVLCIDCVNREYIVAVHDDDPDFPVLTVERRERAIPSSRQPSERANQPWSAYEDDQLMARRERGETFTEIGQWLGRTNRAAQQRYELLARRRGGASC